MKKSSIRSEPTEKAIKKQDKDNVLRMATVVGSEPPAFISPKTDKSTDVEKKKQAVTAARSLPELLVSNYEIRNKVHVMKYVTLAELSKDTGMNKLLVWLDNRFKKDENAEDFTYFKEWMSPKRVARKHKLQKSLQTIMMKWLAKQKAKV